MPRKKTYIFCLLLALFLLFQDRVYTDCFQEVAQQFEAGLIEGFSMDGPWEKAAPVLLSELEKCLGVSGAALCVRLLENFAKLKTEKMGTRWEFEMTQGLISFVSQGGVSEHETLKLLTPMWYQSDGKLKTTYFSFLFVLSSSNNEDPMRDRIWDFDFDTHKALLVEETDKTSILSLSLLDFMLSTAPGRALITLNNTLSPQEIAEIKQSISTPVSLHWTKNPDGWKDDNLEEYKTTLNSLIPSNIAYIDLFIAEIVNVVHDLRTAEIDAFLKQSTHPLVQKRENEPYIHVHPVLPE